LVLVSPFSDPKIDRKGAKLLDAEDQDAAVCLVFLYSAEDIASMKCEENTEDFYFDPFLFAQNSCPNRIYPITALDFGTKLAEFCTF
jgi:hypothetical protein